MTTSLQATVRTRRETHEVQLTVDVTGAPSLGYQGKRDHLELIPDVARITYLCHGERWVTYAVVYGLPTSGSKLLKGWANLVGDPADWPDWLRELADQQHPARPGGWPGDDPSGSYL